MSAPTIGWSSFATKNARKESGNSYSILSPEEVVSLIQQNWDRRTPGAGESGIDRKVLVPVPAAIEPLYKPMFFCPPRVRLVTGMPIKAQVAPRRGQEGKEDPSIELWIDSADAEQYGLDEIPATNVNIVCYSADALLEGGGERTTDCEWEIVTILADSGADEPMHPLTMARNLLGMPGGTVPEKGYTAEEFAQAVWFHHMKGLKVKFG